MNRAIITAIILTLGGLLWMIAGGTTNRLDGIGAVSQELFQKAVSVVRESMLRNHAEYDDIIRRWASAYEVDCTLVKAIIYQEDPAWDPGAVSSKGAIGLMQVMPETANLSQAQLSDPEKNIEAGVKYFSSLARGGACPSSCQNGKKRAADCTLPAHILQATDQYGTIDDGIRFALAAYNGGPCGANVKSSGCPGKARWECGDELRETNQYVPAVIAHYMRLKKNNWGCERNTVINTPTTRPVQ